MNCPACDNPDVSGNYCNMCGHDLLDAAAKSRQLKPEESISGGTVTYTFKIGDLAKHFAAICSMPKKKIRRKLEQLAS